ncbi:hypothetical protein A1O1_03871 [Capronia coronata CBS 617.96]|uniref:holo-[acyl-carrier-protein] synthase n=1 Tax=Capronia coronata CBS 617.96 TaxID=1182541 RepID=W9YD04_9EURO|nr:uncharacterized protein A1O1_03871 [Capronia coronata CBS 617.96]EXJ90767.1 hypothetical protein A1O1_03871 [Capronia coronata CBS 617.96]
MSTQSQPRYATVIDRYYIDTRPLVPIPSNTKSTQPLPLLSTLQYSDQEAVTRFIRPADRFMSLASALLKYTFIHRRAKIPWSRVQVSRTPHPHRRPYWTPLEDWKAPVEGDSGSRIGGLEFNVSHQAGLIAIVGCSTPTAQLPTPHTHVAPGSSASSDSYEQLDLTGHRTPTLTPNEVRLGVDIACTNEDKRTPQDMTTQEKFDEWVDIFAEMFSDRERWNMRHAPIPVPVVEREEGECWDSEGSSVDTANGTPLQDRDARLINLKLRRFYAYWSLKEAYIKMVGEGLLADWLRELEFLNVVAPPEPAHHHPSRDHTPTHSSARTSSVAPKHLPNVQANNNAHLYPPELRHQNEARKWTPPDKAERGMTALLHGKKVEDVDIELVAYDEDFMVSTAMRGVEEQEPGSIADDTSQWKRWLRLDIEEDIKPCAEGRCSCLA